VPIAVESERRLKEERARPDGSAASTPGSASGPGAITSDDDYTTKLVTMLDQLNDLFKETDCDKLAASIHSFADANKPRMDALAAWTKTHTIDDAALAKALKPKMQKFDSTQPVQRKCMHNKAFAAALREMKATAPP